MLQAVAKRPMTNRVVASITHDFYEDWLTEVAAVKKEFEAARNVTENSLYFPSSVALAYRILGLRQRLSSLLDEHKVQHILLHLCKLDK